jgi:pyridoxine kinase
MTAKTPSAKQTAMPLALILSSHVSASRVGGGAQALALAHFRIDCMVAPTVLYGRHPGWGAPGGAAVPVEALEGMLDGIEANGLFAQTDLVLTGYFASAPQVRAAARAIDAVRGAPRDREARKPVIIVDPTIGDAGKGLYVPADVAEAVLTDLVPRADIVAPNTWELQRMTGAEARTPTQALHSARLLGKPVLVSSVQRGSEIGVVYADKKEAWLAAHQRADSAPKGTGDLLSALYGAALIDGLTTSYALARAVSGVAETIVAAQTFGSAELPIVTMGQKMKATSPTVRMERLA